ncbi:anaerobic glycerol-3-phosphate dehydrogenase subunit GlpC [Salinivibrio sp. ES.052]|uniref:anaerobic glycerol-3-phosphate dehydrogenase subunit GlpC n=1 Tax=Salinivibrio sp. ES.052 TaxID=1882823 RepID=UPI0009294172|nr:anaerobic glycerol-3-phosphate dehydrogenase subunit GlpC [Salinivibrio sp. ES.052]SIN81183.1 glycerol 3-phosphate dehydrogenase (quinone) subunit C [Salinivibrio sp. ES.052]
MLTEWLKQRDYSDHAPQPTSFDQCIKCTVCTVYCPVSKANPAYPGPKECGPDGERLRIKNPEYYDDLLKLCTNCKRCETACPSGVKIGDIIAVARGKHGKKNINPKLMRDYVLSHTDLFGTLANPMAPLVNMMTDLKPVKAVMHATIGVDKHKSLPKYSFGTFRRWMKSQAAAQADYPKQVSYFHGCYVNFNNPQLGKDLVKVMNAMGYGVQLLEKHKCCGVPLIANGFYDKARRNATANTAMIADAVAEHRPVIATSSSCALTLKEEYPHVLGVDNAHVAGQISFVTRFLLKAAMNGEMPKLNPINKRVVYHTPCHLERSGNAMFTIELLRMIPGLEVIVLDSECCGLAGTYGFKTENYQTSIAIGSGLFAQIEAAQADFAITDCETCKWQIEENTSLEALHPVSVLAMAVGEPAAA